MKILFLFIGLGVIGLIECNPRPESKEKWEIDEALRGTSLISRFYGNWISDQEFIYKDYNSVYAAEYVAYNVVDKTKRVFLSSEKMGKWAGADFSLTEDNTKFLIRYSVEQVFRHSTVAKYDVYDIATDTSYSIADGKKLQYCVFAPKGGRIAYVLENNVYLRLPNGSDWQLTSDGKVGIIYNGVPDWVYEEEVLATGSALWWSPDGEKLAIANFNDTSVSEFKYFIYGEPGSVNSQYPEEVDLKYPKPGTNNPLVTLTVINVNDNNGVGAVMQHLNAPVDIVSKDHILNYVTWSDDDHVIVVWMNRRQNNGTIVSCEMNGICRQIRIMNEPDGWLMTSDVQCNDEGKTCMMIDWIGNWLQVWEMDLKNGENLRKSYGDFTVSKIYGHKKSTDELFYQGTLAGDSAQKHVYKNGECISCSIKDVEGELCTSASALFSKDFSYFVLTCSGPNPVTVKIFESKTLSEIETWQTNDYYRSVIEKKIIPKIKFLSVKVTGNYDALVKLYLPPDLDWDSSNSKKYPLVVYVYSGPNSAKINTDFTIGWGAYLVTSRNAIYAEIEGRGTGNKGKDMLYTINNQLGTVEIQDQIDVTSFLQKNYNFIDKDRTAIWGWSYGGYATAKVLATDDQRVFQCGASVAPVTSWLYYDTIYTERYMGLPTDNDNLKNYESGGLFADEVRLISNFRNHDFLLMHGVADDNVHVQQSFQLAKLLQTHDIMFEEQMYPDENHGINNLKGHLYRYMDQFLGNCLNLETEDS